MGQYMITYLTGDTDTIEAEAVNCDDQSRMYVFRGSPPHYQAVALIPFAGVRSILRQADEATPKTATTYPHQDGDVTVLGPEVFISADGEVISCRGANYSRRIGPTLGKMTG